MQEKETQTNYSQIKLEGVLRKNTAWAPPPKGSRCENCYPPPPKPRCLICPLVRKPKTG